jgi:hypothetical protein
MSNKTKIVGEGESNVNGITPLTSNAPTPETILLLVWLMIHPAENVPKTEAIAPINKVRPSSGFAPRKSLLDERDVQANGRGKNSEH